MGEKLKSLALLTAFLAVTFSPTAFSALPFMTDDPAPVAYGHWEFYLFSTSDISNFTSNWNMLANETDVGIAPNLELHMIIPYTLTFPQGNPRAAGFGDMEAGLKYRFVNETATRPQIAIVPLFELSTGDVTRGLGNGRVWYQLPIWLQKSWGKWTSYGGGGYAFNSAPGMRNYPFAGWVVQRTLSKRLIFGGELFTQGTAGVNNNAYTIIDLGGYYSFNKNFGAIFSGGHSLAGQNHLTGTLGFYWLG